MKTTKKNNRIMKVTKIKLKPYRRIHLKDHYINKTSSKYYKNIIYRYI